MGEHSGEGHALTRRQEVSGHRNQRVTEQRGSNGGGGGGGVLLPHQVTSKLRERPAAAARGGHASDLHAASRRGTLRPWNVLGDGSGCHADEDTPGWAPNVLKMWGWSAGRQPRDQGVGTCSCPAPAGGGVLGTDFKRVAPNLINRVSALGQRAQRRPWPWSVWTRGGHELAGLPDGPHHAPPYGWCS